MNIQFRKLIYYVAAIICLLIFWQVASYFTPIFLPGIIKTIKGGIEIAEEGTLTNYIGVSLFRIMTGWLLGCGIGIPLGWIIGHSDRFELFTDPYINFLRFLPPITWVTVLLVWFGYNDVTRIGLVMYSAIMVTVINSTAGIKNVDKIRIRAGKSIGLEGRELLTKVKIPSAMAETYTGMRVAMGNAFMTIVAVEMLAADSGLGYEIWHSRLFMRLDFAFICIFFLGTLGFAMDRLLRWMGAKALRKYGVGE